MKKHFYLLLATTLFSSSCACGKKISEFVPWINDISYEDIEMVYSYSSKNGVSPFNLISVYGSEKKEDINKMYNFIKKATIVKKKTRAIDGGTNISTIQLKTTENNFELTFNNGYISYNKTSYKLKTKIPTIKSFYSYKFSSTINSENNVYTYQTKVENIQPLLHHIMFKPIENFDYIDRTTDLTINKELSVIDAKHFCCYSSTEYFVFEIINDYSFKNIIDKYQKEENYYTITLMDDKQKIACIRYDKNILIQDYQVLLNTPFYNTLGKDFYKKVFSDKELKTQLRTILIDSDKTLYISK